MSPPNLDSIGAAPELAGRAAAALGVRAAGGGAAVGAASELGVLAAASLLESGQRIIQVKVHKSSQAVQGGSVNDTKMKLSFPFELYINVLFIGHRLRSIANWGQFI